MHVKPTPRHMPECYSSHCSNSDNTKCERCSCNAKYFSMNRYGNQKNPDRNGCVFAIFTYIHTYSESRNNAKTSYTGSTAPTGQLANQRAASSSVLAEKMWIQIRSDILPTIRFIQAGSSRNIYGYVFWTKVRHQSTCRN